MGTPMHKIGAAYDLYHAACPRTELEQSTRICPFHRNPQVMTPTRMLIAVAFEGARLPDLLKILPDKERNPDAVHVMQERLQQVLDAERRVLEAGMKDRTYSDAKRAGDRGRNIDTYEPLQGKQP